MSLQHSKDDLPSSQIQDTSPDSTELETKVEAARLSMESAVGHRLEIERFEPVQADGEWKLRVFWRKAQR